MKQYLCFGHKVASEIDLPLAETVRHDGIPDFDIRKASSIIFPETLFDNSRKFDVNESCGYFRYQGIGNFRFDSGRTIWVQADYELSHSLTLAAAILGTPLGIIFFQRGFFVCHGAATEIDGSSAVFLGNSGDGKSSLAASICFSGGGCFLSDDVVSIDLSGDQAGVIPSFPLAKLDSKASSTIGVERQAIACEQGKGLYRVPGEGFCSEVTNLGAIYFPRWGRDNEIRIDQLSKIDATTQIAVHAYGPSPRTQYPSETRAHFQKIVKIAGAIPCFTITRPKKRTLMRDVALRVEEHFRSLSTAL